MATILDQVRALQIEVGSTDLQPERASEILRELSSLTGNILKEVLERDVLYNQKLLEIYKEVPQANRAKIVAETSPEYIARGKAKNAQKLVKEMTAALKYYLKEKTWEYQNTR